MNRSALCIQMLHILYGRSTPISKNELATLLETNPRNISEFKKELEIAGYFIETTSGKYGGYVLKEDSIFPSLALNSKEKEAINEALDYLKAQKNFIFYDVFADAMNKVKAKHKNNQKQTQTIYINDAKHILNEQENKMLDVILKAKQKQQNIQIQYRSTHSNDFIQRLLQPYEIIVSSEGVYLLAYDITAQKIHSYKYFKIIEERMQEVTIQKQSFSRDPYFKMQEHIGKNTLMKDLYEVELEIYGLHARLVNEKQLENVIHKSFQDNVLHITFMMEGFIRLKTFILSMGKDCKVISPQSVKDEIAQEIKTMQSLYEKSDT